MAMASLLISRSTTSSCHCFALGLSSCSSRISRAKTPQHVESPALISRRKPSGLQLGTNFLDFIGRRRLREVAVLDSEISWSSRREKAGQARAGLPVVSSIPVLGPVMNAVLNPVVLMIIYLAGASRFWSGFNRTTYSSKTPTKVALTALWPALYIASQAYRANFKKAVL